ncbi:hypothetical protein BT63DRAFT_414339 [Microthyrium microscopicum]|uniref:Uncharacterized protein n=1 Tax=Microthyrium microscopicum TaxID=703497 RepID=A0A6A6U7S9_9PEZI|nr:hypothetical protein BT63DRAFT_414339 [Microthyrium microscopicum]
MPSFMDIVRRFGRIIDRLLRYWLYLFTCATVGLIVYNLTAYYLLPVASTKPFIGEVSRRNQWDILTRTGCTSFSYVQHTSSYHICAFWSRLDSYPVRLWHSRSPEWSLSHLSYADHSVAMTSVENGAIAALQTFDGLIPSLSSKTIRILYTDVSIRSDSSGHASAGHTMKGLHPRTLTIIPGKLDLESCEVAVFARPNDLSRDICLQHIIAHEIYHCTQYFNLEKSHQMQPIELWSEWWVEGAAMFFGEQVSPGCRTFRSWFDVYDPQKPLYRHRHDAGIFFQFLSNQGWSFKKIDGLGNSAEKLKDEQEAINRLAHSDLAGLFPRFAAQLFDSAIYYDAQGSHHQPVRSDYDQRFTRNVWSRWNRLANVEQYSLEASTESFSIARYSLWVQPNETIKLKYKQPDICHSQCLIQFRQRLDRNWQVLDEAILEADDKTSVGYDLLYTYTGNLSASEAPRVKIHATRVKQTFPGLVVIENQIRKPIGTRDWRFW